MALHHGMHASGRGSGHLALVSIVFVCTLLSVSPGHAVRDVQRHSPRALPLHFSPLEHADYDFVARAPGHAVWLGRGEARFAIRGKAGTSTVRMRLGGAETGAAGVGLEPRAGTINLFRGSDPRGWATGIPTFGRVRYAAVLPGIDWEFYGTPTHLEHDFVVAPGSDPTKIELHFEGAVDVDLDPAGGLRVHTEGGVMRLRPPVAYQQFGAQRISVAARFHTTAQGSVGFHVAPFDRTKPLVIDPVIEYSTYYGGTAEEVGYDIVVDDDGNAYVAGTTNSSNLPTTAGAFDETGRVGGGSDPGDAFVAKLAPDGSSLVWATYLSGRGLDRLFGIAIDADRNVYVVGDTDSTDDLGTAGIDESYPQVAAAQTAFGGVSDLVVTKIAASGAALVWSTYLGGNDADRADTENDRPAIDVDSLGRAHISAVTQSTDFDTLYSCTEADPGPFVLRMAADGSSFDTCVGLGGDAFVFSRDLVVDAFGRALVVGFTADPNLNTTLGTFSTGTLMGEDAFLMRVNPAGTGIDAGTYFGGNSDDFANSVALGPSNAVYITGSSAGGTYPITIGGAPSGNAVATKLDNALSTVQYSLALGYNEGFGIAVDSLARATVVGTDGQDAGFTLLAASGSITHETFWGGLLFDTANSVAVDGHGHAYVTGETRSNGFPGDTVLNGSPFQATRSGNIDAWMVKHLRDDPVFVPSMTWGGAPLIAALLYAGRRGLRKRRADAAVSKPS